MRTAGLLLLLTFMPTALSAAAVFPITVDTSTITGSSGAIYLQFSPGLLADYATVEIGGFAMDAPGALVGVPVVSGDVTGILPSTVTLANTDANNDYLHFLTFGTSLQFNVVLNVPSVLSGVSGSQFSLGLTGPDGLSPVLSQDPSGYLATLAYDETGFITVSVLDGSTLVGVPEPGAVGTVGLGLVVLGVVAIARKYDNWTRSH